MSFNQHIGVTNNPLAKDDDREYFEFLDELRESGRTNMMGAGPYLRREFGMDRNEARKVLLRWMRTKRDRRPTYFDRD
tara:strand:- start:316 stop:549 length:234 start_codon:yes stop_codon:yes gene_type:complete